MFVSPISIFSVRSSVSSNLCQPLIPQILCLPLLWQSTSLFLSRLPLNLDSRFVIPSMSYPIHAYNSVTRAQLSRPSQGSSRPQRFVQRSHPKRGENTYRRRPSYLSRTFTRTPLTTASCKDSGDL